LEDGKTFDIFVLDVYIGDEMGTALAGDIRKFGIESPIIFATSSLEHAPQSYETGTLRYLIKPINPGKFYEAMGVAIAQARKMSEHFLKFKTENGVASVNANHIMYSEAHDHYQYMRKDDGEEIKVRMTVTELFTMLSKYGGFVRIGSAYIINLRHVKNVTPTNVSLYSNINIQIPRGKFTEIKNTFWNFQCEGQED
jgi:DNA-binding LytR/AlgR family response regulator